MTERGGLGGEPAGGQTDRRTSSGSPVQRESESPHCRVTPYIRTMRPCLVAHLSNPQTTSGLQYNELDLELNKSHQMRRDILVLIFHYKTMITRINEKRHVLLALPLSFKPLVLSTTEIKQKYFNILLSSI